MTGRHRTSNCRGSRWGLWLVVTMPAGCHDPQFEAKQAMRDRQIAHLLDDYATRERLRPASIEGVGSMLDSLKSHRADCRDRTHTLIEESHRCRGRRGLGQAAARRGRVRSIIAGRPERIPDTFRTLIY